MTNEASAKPSIVERLGEHVEKTMPDNPILAARRVLGERRLQTLLTSILSGLAVSILMSIIYVFASVPGTMREIKGSIDDVKVQVAGMYRADAAKRDFDALAKRVDRGDDRDANHDAAISALSRRVDRVEYVIEVAPATATYARSAHARALERGPAPEKTAAGDDEQ